MIEIDISKNEIPKIKGINPALILENSLLRIVQFMESRVGLNARKVVYGYKPITNTYTRTGRLLGGRGLGDSNGKPKTTKMGKLAYKVEANPQLKGADFNYAPYVESGDGWMKKVGARPFWAPSVKETDAQTPKILSMFTENQLKKL